MKNSYPKVVEFRIKWWNMKDLEKRIQSFKFGKTFYSVKFFGVPFKVILDIGMNIKTSYHGEFDVLKFIQNTGVNEISIQIRVMNLRDIDRDHVLSMIHHELTHAYEALSFENPTSSSFLKIEPLMNIKKMLETVDMKEFIDRVYLSFDHELNATQAMIHDYLNRQSDKNFDHLSNILQNYQPYLNLEYLRLFDPQKFISRFSDLDQLLYLTNLINHEFGYRIIKPEELFGYYQKWNRYFKKMSDKYLKKVKRILKDISIQNESFQYYCYCELDSVKVFSYRKKLEENFHSFTVELFQKVFG